MNTQSYRRAAHCGRFASIRETFGLQDAFDRVLDVSRPIAQFAHETDGYAAEDRFEQAWRTSHCWIRQVRRHTDDVHMDRDKHTDFSIVLAHADYTLPVDVKASVHAGEAFKLKRPRWADRLLFVIADEGASYAEIQRRTIKAIVQFLTEHDRKVLKHLPPRPAIH